ncbi:TetR/AcrR family transcriptional regulator [Nocardioides sp. NPDC127503]|uniref:TetR/AcrR family transcriptional regulator n=1 Tax=Nocardioides sp. NPDC127503 TaxID=3154516 RepID=UPI003320B8AA
MGLRTDTRQRMVASAALLLREHGIAGTSVAKVLAHSNGPRGSVGFHFPGGRRELITDALIWAGENVTGSLREAADAGVDPSVVFVAICQHYRAQLVDTDFAAGCPIGAAMQEAHHDADLGPVVNGIVSDWQTALADLLVGSGRAQPEADDLAVLAISSLEGAIMVARVTRSTAPIDVVVDRVAPLLTERG